ncbi:HAMP domain-containing protein [Shewanella avicenniae]|uniref:histidine kinase n=1 Tax=Shewanella avicenniae TaxID=2814294 RepID=A0ABX7QT82_9GAMM|nr:ATP-binding protein [Shewanella avicenniae]QSX33893.1 HAMP domain-containing protein [Shewanella avicenniae]
MSAFFLPNRLFIKLLLGFWLCSSLIIACVGALPLLQQLHEEFDMPLPIKESVFSYAERLQQHPEMVHQRFNPFKERHRFRQEMRKEMRQAFREGEIDDASLLEPASSMLDARRADLTKVPFYIFAINANGEVVNAKRQPSMLAQVYQDSLELTEPQSVHINNQAYFGPVLVSLPDGEYRLFGALHVPRHIPWFFFFIDHKLLTLFLAIITSGLLCAVLAWHLGKPLQSLQFSANALAKGDLSSRVPTSTANRHDELGQLANAFNSMAEAVEQMVKSQQRLIGDISHELRTPLTRLQLALALARKKGNVTEETDRIAYEADQLEQMIAELLELSRVKLKQHGNKVTLPLEELLSQVLDDGEFEASQRGKELHIDIPEDLECAVHPKPLSRAIENLLRNAIRYSHKTINIRAQQLGQEVCILIDDDGQGIDEAELEAIFKPFYRPESARDRESGGWGLGLAITEAAVAAHHGRISARNKPEGGLEVAIVLPIR